MGKDRAVCGGCFPEDGVLDALPLGYLIVPEATSWKQTGNLHWSAGKGCGLGCVPAEAGKAW